MVVSSKRTGVFVSLQIIHRVYTEQKNRGAIIRLLVEEFENFTMQPVTGFYAGSPEQSFVVEIVGATTSSIRKLAARIKKMNGQKSILIIRLRGDVEAIRW
jgi:hypothetical protein